MKTDWYHMLENRQFETQVKFFLNFFETRLGSWKYENKILNKEPGRVFQNSLIPGTGGYHKN